MDLARAHATLTGSEIGNYADWTIDKEPDKQAGHAPRKLARDR